MLRAVALLIATLLIGYACYLALLFVQQRAVLFPGAAMPVDRLAHALPAGAETVSIPATFGDVHGVLLRARGSAARAPAVLYFHGNAEFADQSAAALEPLASMGLHVLLVEYPGYAGAAGRPSRESLDEAALQGYDWLAARADVDPARIAVIGRSIGTGPATALARRRPVRALVLMSGFASMDEFAHAMGAPAFLLRDRYDNAAALRGFDKPVLLFHGRADEVIPYRHGESLRKAAEDATLVPMACGHNDCPLFEAPFNERLHRFLAHAGVLAN